MWALIKNGVVSETTDIDPTGRFHESFVWAECGESVSQGWVYDGDGFAPPPQEAIPTPKSCTPAQGLVALFSTKQITDSDVLTSISKIPDEEQRYIAQIGYTHSKTWERGSPTMKTIAGLLGLTDSDMDALFAKAVTVQV